LRRLRREDADRHGAVAVDVRAGSDVGVSCDCGPVEEDAGRDAAVCEWRERVRGEREWRDGAVVAAAVRELAVGV
jgi:hypothetical protein